MDKPSDFIDSVPVSSLVRTDEPVSPVPLTSASDIETQIKRLQFLSQQLDLARSACVRVSVPKDWVFHGEGDDAAAYLEGAGGARIAPLIGLQMLRKPTVTKTQLETGGYSITCEADFICQVFGTVYYGVSRTRRSTDQFLSQGGRKEPDEEDVRQAAYTGMIARACQLAAGLSGLTRGELKSRFGFDASGSTSVTYKGGTSQAKKADAEAANPAIKEIDRILLKLSNGEAGQAADLLQDLTKNPEKGWAGKRAASALTENGAKYVLNRLRELETRYDAEQRNEAGKE